MTGHPSEYALDRAALGAAAPDVGAHLARCARCSGVVAARRAPGEPPAWLASVKIGPERRRRRRWWILPIPLLAAAAAMIVAVHGGTIRGGVAGIREKGAPRVTVFVKRGDAVVAWDGRAPIRPGDRLRLSVRAPGYAQVSIASLASPDAPAVLWAGPLERDADTVPPLSFRVDAQGTREVLSVVLSMQPVTPWQHGAVPRRDDRVWSVRLDIPKEVAP
jgi:hypothetical protein